MLQRLGEVNDLGSGGIYVLELHVVYATVVGERVYLEISLWARIDLDVF